MPIASKLYPPTIGKIPAFYGNILTVPFSMNRAVHANEVTGVDIILRNILSDTILIQGRAAFDFDVDSKMEAYFDVSDLNMVPGEFYKVQLAYHSKAGTGFYSSTSTVKCTSKPELTIVGLEKYMTNMHMYHYVGRYSQDGMDQDTTERVYSYHFNVYDKDDNIYFTSGEILHNSQEDTDYNESIDEFSFPKELEVDVPYYLQYVVTTINGLVASSSKYKIMQRKSVDPEMQAELFADLNYENGYITLSMDGAKNNDGVEIAATGLFLISRAASTDNFCTWNSISRFSMQGSKPSKWTWKDFTIEHGVIYKYSIQQYNDSGLYSNRIISNEVRADFEDAFLYDGKRQLKIKYNPKVSSFKISLFEQKQDTIGGRFPFIFRNGNVYYREFPLSGLLSYYSDEEELFISKEDLKFEGHTIDLILSNLYSERKFKTEALEWLTNGKPKIFRSPGEGNFIIRLLNVTMQPVDPTGRMLHSFNSQAYEIAEYTYDNLEYYTFIDTSKLYNKQMRWETIELFRLPESNKDTILNKHPAAMVEFVNMIPGEKIIVDGTYITIGQTGGYLLNNIKDEIREIKLPAYSHGSGYMTYGYYSTKQNLFDTIIDFEIDDTPIQQYIGAHDIIAENNDVRTSLERFYLMNFEKRPIQTLYYSSLTKFNDPKHPYDFYYDFACTIPVEDFSILDPWTVYELRDVTLELGDLIKLKPNAKDVYNTAIPATLNQHENWQIIDIYTLLRKQVAVLADVNNPNFKINPVFFDQIDLKDTHCDYYYDYYNDKIIPYKDYANKIYIDGSEIDITETEDFDIANPGFITSLKQTDGVVANLSTSKRITTYKVEETVEEVKKAKELWLEALQQLKEWLWGKAYPDLDLIERHWLDDFRDPETHWSGVGIGGEAGIQLHPNEDLYMLSGENLGYEAALIWTNIEEGFNKNWRELGPFLTHAEKPITLPPLKDEDYIWSTCCSILTGEETTDTHLLSGYVLAGTEFTLFETLHHDAPVGWDKVWIDLTPYEITGEQPYSTSEKWEQAFTDLGDLRAGLGDSWYGIGFWQIDEPTDAELVTKVPVCQVIDPDSQPPIIEQDYDTVIANQRILVKQLYVDYIKKLEAALIEDEEARKQ